MAKSAKPCCGSTGLSRRRLLGGALGIGFGLHLGSASAKADDPRKLPPQVGDDLVHPSWDGDGRLVRIDDVGKNGPPLLVYPRDPASGIAREKSRLNQILLVRFDENELSTATKADAAAGIVAYSGVCTHTGCSVTEWDTDSRNLLCPCHASQFDPRNGAKIIGGPATRPLPILPLALAGENLKVSAPFSGKLGGKKT
jgi:Rieske Fe-S protein